LALVNAGRAVDAIYRDAEIPDYEGNPLIEALPAILTTEDAMERLAHYPLYNEALRERPDHIRRHLIQNNLRFFTPLDVHLDLERRFSCLLRVGYVERNPLARTFWRDVDRKVDALDQYATATASWRSTAAVGFNIAGISGAGKSQSVERILSLYPQVIRHSGYDGRSFTASQIVWLKLDCPSDASLKGLCENFFQTVDAILGTNYQRNYAGRRNTVDQMLPNMALVASMHMIGVLVIDEIQRLSLARSGGAERMLNFFVQLVNTVGVPVVLIGTYKALPILSGEFSQMRRGCGQGDLVWDRMKNDAQWQLFVEALWEFQYTRHVCCLADNSQLKDVLYEETAGITDLAIKCFAFAQDRAIDSGQELIGESIIRSVARDRFGMLRPVLEAIKSGDHRALLTYEDVYPQALKGYLEEQQPVQLEGHIATVPDIALALQKASASPEATPESGKRESHKGRRSNKGKGSAKGVLPELLAGAKAAGEDVSVYDVLKDSGHIRAGDEWLAGRV
jgi:hypothetical protein